jgi:hypothetical protein
MNLFHRLVAEAMQGTDKSLGFGWGEGDNSRRMPFFADAYRVMRTRSKVFVRQEIVYIRMFGVES